MSQSCWQRGAGGNYLLSVRDNQPTLREDIEASFEDADDRHRRPIDQPAALVAERLRTTDKAHGRLEQWEFTVIRDLRYLQTKDRWPGLSFIVCARSTRTSQSTGKETIGVRYFIGSNANATAEEIAACVRNHWGVENSVHWVLDMAFDEDRARHRAGNCAQNLTTLRHFALNLLKTETSCKLGIANKRKRAGWSRDYLLTVLTGPRS